MIGRNEGVRPYTCDITNEGIKDALIGKQWVHACITAIQFGFQDKLAGEFGGPPCIIKKR